jgi:hypothetical protein
VGEFSNSIGSVPRRSTGQTPGPVVRLCAPAGVTHVQLLSGIRHAVPADGTIEMTEADAAPLLQAGWAHAKPLDDSPTLRSEPATFEIVPNANAPPGLSVRGSQ